MRHILFVAPVFYVVVVLSAVLIAGCGGNAASAPQAAAQGAPAPGGACELVPQGWGPAGSVPLHVEKMITGLEVPWSIAFLPGGDWLLTERPGRIRLVRGGQLVAAPVAQLSTGETGEGGLLGLALHPAFAANGLFYVFYTTVVQGNTVNRIERFVLSADHSTATSDRVILDGIPSGVFHDGGRIKFGPDGMLYAGTGDSQNPPLAQDMTSLNGKILRLDPDGGVPAGNPFAGSPVFASGVRNLEAFDWVDPATLVIADNGPTGELGLTGLDKVALARAGNDLGWPTITGCATGPGLVTPLLTWQTAAPPGGGLIYHGGAIPEFAGDFIVGMMGIGAGSAMQLHRVVLDPSTHALVSHEVYLQGQYGRLRDVEQGPDGALYVTTTNCDSRGTCPADGDYVLRITHQ